MKQREKYLVVKAYAIIATVILAIPLNLSAQQGETAYFRDVTSTHVPQDPKAHALGVAFADVDRDGDLDVVLAMEKDANRLYLNEGKGKLSWKQGVFSPAKHDSEHVRMADFDGDGNIDAIFVAEDDQNHEYYLGNGDGTFREVSNRLLAKSEGNGLDVGDVNGDGLPDVVVGNSGEQGQDFLWINDPSRPGYFIDRTTEQLPQVNDATQGINLADLDGDNDLDMVIGNEIPSNRLLINDGKGVFTEQKERLELPVPLHTREVLLFDVDNDGDRDIVFANLTNNGGEWDKDPRTRLLLNDGKANFNDETNKRMPANTFSTYAAAPIDFDQDGDLDLLLSAVAIPGFSPIQGRAYENDGKGNFKDISDEAIPTETIGRLWGIAIGDIDGDGIDDAFIGGWGTQARLLLGKRFSAAKE